MAETLLAHGANANTNVYAATSAMYEAYKRHDESMMALLEEHGGRLTAVAVAELGLVAHAARLLAEDAAGRTPDGIAGPDSTVARDLLWGAIESPSPEIVMLALQATDWPREDPRWHGILENGLYLRSGERARSSPRRVSAGAGSVRSQRSKQTRSGPGPRYRGVQGRTHRERPGRIHDAARRPRRAPRLSGRSPPEHTARMGVPLGTNRDGEAAARAWCRSARSRRGTVGHSRSLGEKDGPL